MATSPAAALKAARFVSYLRVSTARQGASGLGMEAQREAVHQYLKRVAPGALHLQEYVEVESGKAVNNRPQLQAALRHARHARATLIIAKLDRLSRNAAFLLALRDSGVKFVAADMPDACDLTVGVLAVVAEHGRAMISARTKAALQAAKARGRKLGNPNGARCLRGLGNTQAVAAVKANAAARAEELRDVLADVDPEGSLSARGLATALNTRGFRSPRGGRWTAQSVIRLRERLQAG